MTLDSLDRAAVAEVLAIFPELQTDAPPPVAHACLRHWEGTLLRSG